MTKNVAMGLAIALVLVAAIVPALPQSLCDRREASRQSTGDDILRNPDSGNQTVE